MRFYIVIFQNKIGRKFIHNRNIISGVQDFKFLGSNMKKKLQATQNAIILLNIII